MGLIIVGEPQRRQMTLNWDRIEWTTQYMVVATGMNAGQNANIVQPPVRFSVTSATQTILTGLVPNVRYQIRLEAAGDGLTCTGGGSVTADTKGLGFNITGPPETRSASQGHDQWSESIRPTLPTRKVQHPDSKDNQLQFLTYDNHWTRARNES